MNSREPEDTALWMVGAIVSTRPTLQGRYREGMARHCSFNFPVLL
jgi:hypothetical protein